MHSKQENLCSPVLSNELFLTHSYMCMRCRMCFIYHYNRSRVAPTPLQPHYSFHLFICYYNLFLSVQNKKNQNRSKINSNTSHTAHVQSHKGIKGPKWGKGKLVWCTPRQLAERRACACGISHELQFVRSKYRSFTTSQTINSYYFTFLLHTAFLQHCDNWPHIVFFTAVFSINSWYKKRV